MHNEIGSGKSFFTILDWHHAEWMPERGQKSGRMKMTELVRCATGWTLLSGSLDPAGSADFRLIMFEVGYLRVIFAIVSLMPQIIRHWSLCRTRLPT
ncbi:MAG: hypothetical protein DI535_08080 [Citrobacter freundii]|nr:MAG: hypothetical protein DI535_08080 [Citrobacter freundii]